MSTASSRTKIIISLAVVTLGIAGAVAMIGVVSRFRAQLASTSSMTGAPSFMPRDSRTVPNLDEARTIAFDIVVHNVLVSHSVIRSAMGYMDARPGGMGGGWTVSIGKSRKLKAGERQDTPYVCFGRVNDTEVCSQGTLVVGKQHHVAVVYTGSDALFYIDGALDSSVPFRSWFFTQQNPYVLGDGFRGFLSDVRVYSKPLGPADIAALANNQAPNDDSLLGQWLGSGPATEPSPSPALVASGGGANVCTRPAAPWVPYANLKQENGARGAFKVSVLRQPESMQSTDTVVPFEIRITNTDPSVTIDDAELSFEPPVREWSVPDGEDTPLSKSDAGLECSSDPDCTFKKCNRIVLAPGESRTYKIVMKIDKFDCGSFAPFTFLAQSYHYPQAIGRAVVKLASVCPTQEGHPFLTKDPLATEARYHYITRLPWDKEAATNFSQEPRIGGIFRSLDGNFIVKDGLYRVENLPEHYKTLNNGIDSYNWPELFDTRHPELGFVKLPPVPKDVLNASSQIAQDLPYSLRAIGISQQGGKISLKGQVQTSDGKNVFTILVFERATQKYSVKYIGDFLHDSNYSGAEYLTEGIPDWKLPDIHQGLPTRLISLTNDGRLALFGTYTNDYFAPNHYYLFDTINKTIESLHGTFGVPLYPDVLTPDCNNPRPIYKTGEMNFCSEEITTVFLTGTKEKPLIFFTLNSLVNGERHFKSEFRNFIINGVKVSKDFVDTKQYVFTPYVYDVLKKQATPLFSGTPYSYERLVSINPQMYGSRGATVQGASPDGRYVYLVQRRGPRENIPMPPPDPSIIAYDRLTQGFIRLPHLHETSWLTWGDPIGIQPFVFRTDTKSVLNTNDIPPGTFDEKLFDGRPAWAVLMEIVLPDISPPPPAYGVSSGASSAVTVPNPLSSSSATVTVPQASSSSPAALPVTTVPVSTSVANSAPVALPNTNAPERDFGGLTTILPIPAIDGAKTVTALVRDTAPVSDKQAPKGIVMSGAPNGWGLYLGKNNLLCFGKIGVSEKCSTKPVSPNAEHHVAVVLDGKQVSFYIDGAPDSSVPYAETFNAGGSQYFIGGAFYQIWNSSNFFYGPIKNVRAYSVALSADDIRAVAKGAGTTSDALLLGSWLQQTPALPPVGDVNADGTFGAADTILVQRHLNGSAPITDPAVLKRADADASGTIDNADVLLIQARGLGLVNSLPAKFGDLNHDLQYSAADTIIAKRMAIGGAYSPSDLYLADVNMDGKVDAADADLIARAGLGEVTLPALSENNPSPAPANPPAPGASCGDGALQAAEQCDDGNAADNDGCSARCMDEFCGDGVVQPPEQCDDGNTRNNDACSSRCMISAPRALAPVPAPIAAPAPSPVPAPVPVAPSAAAPAVAPDVNVTDCAGKSWLDFVKCMSGF